MRLSKATRPDAKACSDTPEHKSRDVLWQRTLSGVSSHTKGKPGATPRLFSLVWIVLCRGNDSNMKAFLLYLICLVPATTLCSGWVNAQPAAPTDSFRKWGLADIQRLDAAFRIPTSDLYADEITPGPPPVAGHPAFMWGCGIALSALNAAARLDRPTYLPEVRRYVTALDAYWVESKGIGGYEVPAQAESG